MVNRRRQMPAPFYFKRDLGNGERVADAPVAGGIQPEPFAAVSFKMSIARAGVHFVSGYHVMPAHMPQAGVPGFSRR